MISQEQHDQWKISGAGGGKGGGGGGDAPEEADDTLFSTSEAAVMVAVCEGEIEGYARTKKQSVYLNDTQVQNDNGTDNFGDEIKITDIRRGTNDQSPLGDGFDDVEIEQTIGVKVTRDQGGTSATTTRNDLSRLRVRVGVSALYQVQDDGDITGDKVEYRITINDSISGSPIIREQRNISGKSRGPFEQEHSYALSGTGPWSVKVERRTSDSDTVAKVNDFYFKAIVGIVDSKFSYPMTAVMGMKFKAEQFSSIPRVSVHVKGLKIQVPNNYRPEDVDTDGQNAYSGTWNGLFKTAYSNNPAWVFYDLLTNDRYGCGDFINASDVDKFALYDIAKYCDELVSDGRGGQERRFVFNGHINNRGEAYEVLNSIAATFRGMLYYHQGTIVATQDNPSSAVKVFTPANVIQEVDDQGRLTAPPFSYEGTGRKARKTVCLVSWNDPNDLYRTKVEYVEDGSAIEKYGYREMEIRAFGCTSQGQAQRIGRWNLVTNLTETETVTFKVAAEGFFLLPGEIIEIGDPSKTPGLAAGYIGENSYQISIFLDRPVNLAPGKAYLLFALISGVMEGRPVSTVAGDNRTQLTVNPGFSNDPDIGTPWVLKEDNGVESVRQYRVIGCNEGEDGTVTVLAVSHNATKYDQIESLTALQTQPASVARVNALPTVNAGGIRFEIG